MNITRDLGTYPISVNPLAVAFRDGHIPEEWAWTMMVLIPKILGGYRGIGLVEVVWKFFSSIVNNRLQSTIILHGALHGFIQVRVAGVYIMDTKLEQQLTGIVHTSMFQVFLDVQKSYNSLYRGRCMEILRGYGLVHILHRLLQSYWYGQKVVPKAGIFWASFQNGERGDTWGPGIPDDLQHSFGCSGKGGPTGILWTPVGTSWVWMVSG